MSLSDLQSETQTDDDQNRLQSSESARSNIQPNQSASAAATSFPLYHKILEKCLNQSSYESMINLSEPGDDPVTGPYLTSVDPSFQPHSILCSNIRNSHGQTIGCVQLVDKPLAGFTKSDEHFVEAFVIFCGLGISNTRTYEESVLLSNKQKVAMEMLSYYTKASEAEVKSVLSHAHRSSRHNTTNNSTAASSSYAINSFSSVPSISLYASSLQNNLVGMSEQQLSAASKESLDYFNEHTAASTISTSGNQYAAPAYEREVLKPNDQTEEKKRRVTISTMGAHPINHPDYMSVGVSTSTGKSNGPAANRKSSAPPHLHKSGGLTSQSFRDHESIYHCDIYNFRLDELKLSEVDTLSSALAMFREMDLIRVLRTDEKTLVKWLVTTKKNYRQVTYHNWRHAFSVCQLMFAILTTGELHSHFSPLQRVAFLLATLSHDLDHRGTNNSFQKLIESPLAQLYSTSTLEHHHFDRFRAILEESSCDILANLAHEQHQQVMSSVEHAIISTDLALYFQKRGSFFDIVKSRSFDIADTTHHGLLCSMLMTASDLGAITRPWHVEYQVANMIAEEFFEQGDIEREVYNKDLIPMFDRSKQSEIPKLQLSFIDVICAPIYENLALLYPSLQPLLDGLEDNRRHWSDLADEELHKQQQQKTHEEDSSC